MRPAAIRPATLAVLAMMLVWLPRAAAQNVPECEANSFGSRSGELYLEAENQLFVEEDTAEALVKIEELRERRLNCYELSAVLKLAVAAYYRDGQVLKAAQTLEEVLETGALTGDNLLLAYYQVAQLYLDQQMLEKGRDYLMAWLEAGAMPNVGQFMQLASVHYRLDEKWESARFLEEILRIESMPNKTVIDFVILVYSETGQDAKLADFVRYVVIPIYPGVKRYWEASAAYYFKADDDRSAFETIKAMYLAGMLTSEDEIMRVVNFYNQFDTPLAAATVLAEEIEAGRVEKTPERLETLASLFQISREYQAAIPPLRDLAALTDTGAAFERLGRSHFELGQHAEAVEVLEKAVERGDVQDIGGVWSLIGRARHQSDQREAAREAFAKAEAFESSRTTAQAWLKFMDDEDFTAHARRIYETRVARDELSNIVKSCNRSLLLGTGAVAEECDQQQNRLADITDRLAELIATLPRREDKKERDS